MAKNPKAGRAVRRMLGAERKINAAEARGDYSATPALKSAMNAHAATANRAGVSWAKLLRVGR